MSQYLIEIKQLIAALGSTQVARSLGVTERTVAYWVAETGNKVPNDRKQKEIHELFKKWKAGESLQTEGKDIVNDALISARIEILMNAMAEVVSASSGENPAVIRKKFEKAAEELAKMG